MKSGFVSIIGRPNVGKSTLMNKIVGEKIVITSDKPQTTRNRIQGIHTGEAGQIVFVDTPGIHKPRHLLGEYMVDMSTRSLQEVDVIYYMTDVTRPFGSGEQYIIDRLQDIAVPIFLLINKIDLADEEETRQFMEPFVSRLNFADRIAISATQGTNLDHLLKRTMERLPEGPMYYPADFITDQPTSFLVAELIREKALLLTRDEVPHSLAVEIEEFKQQEDAKIYIRASINTERDSQKGIIIGKNGQMLRNIGARARTDIEALLDRPVYLDLWVKVKKNWRDNEKNLRQLGYHD
ncbi:MAG: GTPase Era [Syntrophomonadaceae bacterium]|nr:GTPase Era [Syntrophomonadaceae bacterium]